MAPPGGALGALPLDCPPPAGIPGAGAPVAAPGGAEGVVPPPTGAIPPAGVVPPGAACAWLGRPCRVEAINVSQISRCSCFIVSFMGAEPAAPHRSWGTGL
jgi:hypothetical protein